MRICAPLSRIGRKAMAFVPYDSSVRFTPASSTSSYRKILPSTSSTYVYSTPVITSHFKDTSFVQEQPTGLSIDEVAKQVLPEPQEPKEGQHKRTHFTAHQRRELEKIFSESQYVTPQKRSALSQQLGISQMVIQTWFKNRRVKWRKEQRKRQTDAVSSACSPSTGLYFSYFGHVPYPSSNLMLNDARMLYGPSMSLRNSSCPE